MSSKRRLEREHRNEGPEALRDWVLRHRGRVQSAYREHVRMGGPADSVMWVMPATESLADPPRAVAPFGRDAARRRLVAALPRQRSLHDDIARPPSPGYFYVVASRSDGRFQGTFLGMLSIPDPGAPLPEAIAVTLPDPEIN